MGKAEEIYEGFTGREVDERYQLDLPEFEWPDKLVELGRVVSITYEAEKHEDKKVAHYKHDFDDARLYCGPDGARVLYVIGRFVVRPEGIADETEIPELEDSNDES